MSIFHTKRVLAYCALALVVIFCSTPALAQEKPIKLGAIYILSGSAAAYGQFAEQGMQLAIDEINADGGVLGRPLEYSIEDSQAKVSAAIQAARKLVYQEQVDALIGLDSSGVAQGLVPIVPELKKPLIITHASTPDATGELCNSYTYRVSDNIAQHMNAAARIAAETGAKRWTTIGPDYAFGRQTWDYFGEYLTQMSDSAQLLDYEAFPPFGEEAFTPYINAVMDADPDGVMISLWGGDLVNFIRQANDLGFFEQDYELLFAVGGATEVLSALGDQMPKGVWLGTRYWYDAYDNPINERFVSSYIERHGTAPSYNAEGAYAAVYAYKAAMEKAGTTDGKAVAQALAGLSFEAPNGTVTFRPGNHQAMVPPNWGLSASMNEELGIRNLDPIRVFDPEKVTPPVSETGCEL